MKRWQENMPSGAALIFTGNALHLTGVGRRRAFAPSLDRLDNHVGYEQNNVRLVCRIANFAMNIWGDAALLELSKGVVSTWERACDYQFGREGTVKRDCAPNEEEAISI